jgi:spore maturation protein CgeB
LNTRIHGVRYPQETREALAAAGVDYAGWIPNHRVPDAFARARVTVHVPRGPYSTALPGIPTIRMFEALACGIPLVSAPWSDSENLFPADCYLRASNEQQMTAAIRLVLRDVDAARELVAAGLSAIRRRHTCAHRVDELLEVVGKLEAPRPATDQHAANPELEAMS